MICPKCGFRKLFECRTVSTSSSLESDPDASVVSGMSCPICAKWIEVVDEPVMKYNFKADQKTTKAQRERISINAGISKLSAIDKEIWAKRVTVTSMIKTKKSITEIMEFVCVDIVAPSRKKTFEEALERFTSGRLKKVMNAIERKQNELQQMQRQDEEIKGSVR